MSIKPIDAQVVVQRATDAAKVRGDEQSKAQQIAQSQEQAVKEKAEQDTRRVHSQAGVQDVQVRTEKEKTAGTYEHPSKKKKKNGKKSENESEDEAQHSEKTKEKLSSIDIRI